MPNELFVHHVGTAVQSRGHQDWVDVYNNLVFYVSGNFQFLRTIDSIEREIVLGNVSFIILMKFDLAFYSLHSAEASTCVANVLYKNIVFVQDNFELLNTVWQAIEQTSWTVSFVPMQRPSQSQKLA